MVFLGGSILARLMQGGGSANCWVTKKEWQEQGERVLDRMDGGQ